MTQNQFPVDEELYQEFRSALLRAYAERGLLPAGVDPDQRQEILPSSEFGTTGSGTEVGNARVIRDDSALATTFGQPLESLALLSEDTFRKIQVRELTRAVARMARPSLIERMGRETYDDISPLERDFERRFAFARDVEGYKAGLD